MKVLLVLLLPIIILNCSQKLTPIKNSQEQFTPTTIAKGELHGAGEEGITKSTVVIKDESTWNALMAKMNAVNPVTESFTETSIDFSKYHLIAVFESLKNTGGFSIEVNCLETPDKIRVQCKTIGPSGFATMIMTQPYYIIKIPITGKDIVIED